MQHDDELISISAAAKAIGVNRSTLSRQIADGHVRSHAGKVRLSEVLEDRIANIDLGRSRRREGQADDDEAAVASTGKRVASAVDATADDDADATDADDGLPVLVDGQTLAYKDARALKETYLARLRKLEFQIKSGAFIEIETVGRMVEQEYSVIRERFLALPAKMASKLDGRARCEIETLLRDEVQEILEELQGDEEHA